MKLTCPRCRTCYVDPSPAAMLEPRPCPHCGYTPRPKRKRVAVDASPCPVCGTGCVDGVCRCDGEAH